jgi:hypothetical protein
MPGEGREEVRRAQEGAADDSESSESIALV